MDQDIVEVQYSKIARYCLLGQPITAQDLIYLARSQSKPHYENVHYKETVLTRVHLYLGELCKSGPKFLITRLHNLKLPDNSDKGSTLTTLDVYFNQFMEITSI